MAERLEKPSHLAIATFFEDHPVPAVRAFARALAANAFEAGRDTVERNAFEELSFLRRSQRTADARRVLAFESISGVHQAVCKLAGIGEEQKSRAVQIEPPHRDPAPSRKAGEHGRAPLRVALRHKLADRLVIEQDARLCLDAKRDGLPVDQHRIGKIYTVAELGRLAVDRDAAGGDPGFDLPP